MVQTGTDLPSGERRRPRRRTIAVLAALTVLAASVGVAVGGRNSKVVGGATQQAQIASSVKSAVDAAMKKSAAAPARSVQVYRAIVASLVYIRTDRAAAPGAPAASALPGTEPAERIGVGTGVVINADGSVLTANHVISGAKKIELTFADGTTTTATVASQAPENDIATLIPTQLPDVIVPAVLGGGVQVGDETYAVGHPLGLTGSLSAGVISGLDRSVPIDDATTLEGLIQFDAAVNPGSSGGPLLNRNAQVVGIVTALANPSEQGFFVGIGFAVPIGTAAGGGGPGGAPPQ